MLLQRSVFALPKEFSRFGRQNIRMISTTETCFRGKINIQKPQKPHYRRAVFNAVTEPIIPRTSVTQECYQKRIDKKLKSEEEKVVHPLEAIIAKGVKDWFNRSKLVAVFHLNSMKDEDFFNAKVAFFKQNMHLKLYGISIMKQALIGTQFESMIPLFTSKYCILFSEEPKIGQLLKISKKIPQMILLTGIVENQFLSKNELVNLSKLPDLTTARAQFVGVLNSVGGGLVNNLQAHQTNLCSLLDMHAKSKDTEDDGSKNSDSVEST